jgi:PAS domain S-box-containing protein
MRDRIVAMGGRLTIESQPGRGTRVAGTIPVGLAQLTPDVEQLLQRATDALEECFAIYKAVRDSSGAVTDFAVEHLNDAACRDIGSPREALIGRTLGYLRPGYLQSEVFDWHRHALGAEGPSSLEDMSYEQTPASRRLLKAYEVRAVPVGGGRLAVTWREITERKREENELLLQSTILERAAEGVCLVRAADGAIVHSNPRFDQMFGYEPGELHGRHVSELTWEREPGEAERRTREILSRLDEHGEASYEQLVRHKDGTPFWSDIHVTAFEHADYGKVWVAVHRNVTARKRVQDALTLSEEHVRQAVEGSPLVLYTMDRNLRYTWALNNQVGMEGTETVVGRTDEELFGHEVARDLSRINRRALAGSRVRAQVELNREGGRVTLDLAVAPLRRDDGRVVGVAGVAYELTGRPVARFRAAAVPPLGG